MSDLCPAYYYCGRGCVMAQTCNSTGKATKALTVGSNRQSYWETEYMGETDSRKTACESGTGLNWSSRVFNDEIVVSALYPSGSITKDFYFLKCCIQLFKVLHHHMQEDFLYSPDQTCNPSDKLLLGLLFLPLSIFFLLRLFRLQHSPYVRRSQHGFFAGIY